MIFSNVERTRTRSSSGNWTHTPYFWIRTIVHQTSNIVRPITMNLCFLLRFMGKSQVGEVNCSLGFWINNVLEVSANLGKKCEIMVAQSLSIILWHFFNKKTHFRYLLFCKLWKPTKILYFFWSVSAKPLHTLNSGKAL